MSYRPMDERDIAGALSGFIIGVALLIGIWGLARNKVQHHSLGPTVTHPSR